MCGHVGIAGNLVHADEATLKRLLLFDYFRGPDSTGFAAVGLDKSVTTVKIASHPLDIFDMKKFAAALNAHRSSAFLGHNRFATKGAVNSHNAHPYTFDHITGAHNGTLDKASWVALEKALGEEFEVDSMAIIAGIARLGLDQTISLLQGAWALVWFDSNNNSLNFLRNKERTFWFCYNDDFDKVFWASEHHTIAAAVGMSVNYDYKINKNEEGFTYFATKENWHYRFDLEKLRAGSKERPKPTVKKIEGKEPAPVTTYKGHAPFQRDTVIHGLPTSSTTTLTTIGSSHEKSKVNQNPVLLNFRGSTIKPLGDFVSKAEFDALASCGCSYCSQDIEYGEKGVKVFKDRGYVLCQECSGGGDVSRIYLGPEESNKLLSTIVT